MRPFVDVGHADDLPRVEWLIHDCFFDLDDVAWNEEERTLRIPFGRGRKGAAASG